jgi:Icc-related predicted phosphoesterase
VKSVCTIILMLCAFATPAFADELPSWDAYMRAQRHICPGPLKDFSPARKIELGGKTYTHTGHKMVVENPDADKNIKIGILGAIKDMSKATRNNLDAAIKWFKSEGVEWIVANGDISRDEFDLVDAIEYLAQIQIPILMLPGNIDSAGSFARAYIERSEKYPNLVNGMWVRQIAADDIEFWVVPGYHDKRFMQYSSSCLFKDDDVQVMLDTLMPEEDAPLALVSHGPPRGKGKHALDYIIDGENVGHKGLAKLVKDQKIPFGIYGHILESGGRGVQINQKSPVKEGKKSKTLHVNAGAMSAFPWVMHNHRASYGMAMMMVIQNSKAFYKTKRFKHQRLD